MLKVIRLGVFVCVLLTLIQCAGKTAPTAALPRDILGISVYMPKDDAQNHLKEIGKLIRLDEKRQEVWVLKQQSRFSHLAVGYNKENQVSYVTAIANPNAETFMKPEEVGALKDAKQEISGPNYRYLWQVAANGNQSAYSIVVQGNQPDRVSMYTLSALSDGKSASEEDEEDEERESEKRK